MSSVLGAHIYDGVLFSGGFPAEHIDRVKSMKFFDNDVLIATYPKSGDVIFLIILKWQFFFSFEGYIPLKRVGGWGTDRQILGPSPSPLNYFADPLHRFTFLI